MTEFDMDGVTFSQEIGGQRTRTISSGDRFVLVKTSDLLDIYRDLKKKKPEYIMEIGMYEGGSMVFYDKLYSPKILVGVDVRKNPITALEEYKKTRPHIKTYYGRYQENPGTLAAARQNFTRGIDLIIDDASHQYQQTKKTFQMLFPFLRAGGSYVIEDWAWSHRPAHQGDSTPWAACPALTNLVFELVLLASQTSVIKSVCIHDSVVIVEKALGVFREDSFNFSRILRGKTLAQL